MQAHPCELRRAVQCDHALRSDAPCCAVPCCVVLCCVLCFQVRVVGVHLVEVEERPFLALVQEAAPGGDLGWQIEDCDFHMGKRGEATLVSPTRGDKGEGNAPPVNFGDGNSCCSRARQGGDGRRW